MSIVNFAIKIPEDIDGFVRFECPFCESEFKLKASEFQDEENPYIDFFCPYCGLYHNKSYFYSKEIIEQSYAITTNYIYEQISESFGNIKKGVNNTNVLKVNFKQLRMDKLRDLKEKETVEEIFECPICLNHEKVLYCFGESKVFCAYCGVDI